MAWSVLQSKSTAATATNSTTVAATFSTANLTSGSKIIAYVGWASGSTTTVSSVKDGAGNSFTKMVSAPNSSGPSGCDCWQIDTPSGDAGTKPTITVTFGASVQASLLIQEVSGLATGTTTTAVLDGTAGTKTGAGGSSTGVPTYVSSASSEFLVSVYGDDGGPETLGTVTGLTKDTNVVSANSHADVGVAYGNSTGTTETNGSWALSGTSADWGMILVAFKLASGGGGNTSTGSIALPKPSLAGTAAETFAATGSIALPKPSLSGTALGGDTTTAGSIALPKPSLAGTATVSVTITSTGSVALPKPSFAASALGGNTTATGSVALPKPALAGTAAETFRTTGSIALPKPSLAGTGAGGNTTASGSIALPKPALAGSGTVSGGVTPTFPDAPLGATVELDLDGWTDITGDVAYKKTPVTIVRGHADEATVTQPSSLAMKLDNTSKNFSSKNPLGTWYGLLGRNTPTRVSIPESTSYLRLEDDAVSYISCPASTAIEIAGDFDVRIDVKLTSWQKCTLAARYDGGTTAWWWGLNADATLGFWWYDSGGTARQVTSTSPVPYYGRFALRVTVAASTGTATFYTAPTISGSWTQLGSPVDTAGTSVRGGTSPIQVGYSAAFASTGFGFGSIQGRVYAFQLLNGIGGTVEAGPDFTTATAGASTLTDAQGNTWTLQGTAEFSDRKYRGHFEASSWAPSSEGTTGLDLWTDVQGAGILRRITQGTQTLGSVFYRAFTQVSPPDDLVGYWSCEDGNTTAAGGTPATPTQFASAIPGVAAGTFTGGPPSFASDSTFLCSQSLPTINGSRWHFRLPGRPAADSANVLRFLCNVPSSGDTNNGVIGRMYTTGTVAQFDLVYTTGGGFTMNGYDQNGNSLFSSGPWVFSANGAPYWLSMELQTSGSDVQYSVTGLEPGATTGPSPNGTVSGSIGNATEFVVNGNQGTASLSGTAIGQITYQATWESLFDFGQQLNAYQGEVAGQRFARLCAEQGITFRCTGPLDDTVPMGAQTALALSDLLQECVDADVGAMYEPREALALAYRTRASMQNQAAALALNYSTDGLTGLVAPIEDDQYTHNDVVATRAYAAGGGTGSSAEVQATTGPLSTAGPPDGVGEYIDSVTVNVAHDSQLGDAAGWRVWLGTVDQPRYPAIPYDLARHDIGANLYVVPDLDIGDRLTIGTVPEWEPPDGIDGLVNQVTENIGERSYDIAWCTVPGQPYETGTLGNLVFGVDTDGSTLHANAASTATSITVDTTAASPTYLWTVAAADFPFDILVSGERMTVTNITGSSSPQTFTVTRSVNSVVKAQTAGTAVSLFHPAIASL